MEIDKKKTVLFVTRTLHIGGAETQMYLLIRELIRFEYQPAVFALEADGPMASWLYSLRVPVFSGGLLTGEIKKKPWKLFAAWTRLHRTIRKITPEVIHAWLPLMTFIGAVSGRIHRVPRCIVGRLALGTHQDRYPFLKWLDLAAEAMSHQMIVNSLAVKKDIIHRQRFFHHKITVIYNGIDTADIPDPIRKAVRSAVRRQLGIGEDENVVIVVANLIHYKGHADLIDAAGILKKKGKRARYLLVGEDRGILKALQDQVSAYGLEEEFRFLGQRQDVEALYIASDISMLPSHEEGFSNVILESMRAGLPVVATRVGGNPEAVIDAATGWLTPAHRPDILAQKLMDLLDHPDRAKEWGSAGEMRVRKNFGIQRMVRSHMKIYEAE